MRHATSLFALALAGCTLGFSEATDDTASTDDTGDVTVDIGCDETYSVPGPGGLPLDVEPDGHANTFGDTEYIDATNERLPVGPDPKHVHLGFPGQDTSRSVAMLWTTDTGTLASQLQYGVGADLAEGDLTETVDGVSFTFGGSDDDSYRQHEVKLCGMVEPGETYSYRVGGEGHWSDIYTFTVPMAPGSFDTFTAVISGDSRGSYEEWGELVAKMAAESPDIYLFSGDMVETGTNQREWYSWWEASEDVFAESFFVPAIGNHEFVSSNYFAQFSMPNNEQYYALEYGNMMVVALIDVLVDQSVIDFDQVSYMDNTFGKSDADWKVAMHHIPTYSVCSRHGSSELLRGSWEATFEGTGVDLVLNGHNHIYERSVPIKEGKAVELGEGTQYLVSGGGGAPLYEQVDQDWFNVESNPIVHYIVAEFDSTGVSMTVKDLQGNTIDDWRIPLK